MSHSAHKNTGSKIPRVLTKRCYWCNFSNIEQVMILIPGIM